MDANTTTARDRRLACPRGSFEAQHWLAVQEADEAEADPRRQPQSDLALLCSHVAYALRHAVGIAWQSRAEAPNTSTFVGDVTRLEVYFKRAEALTLESGDLWQQWPTSPGTTFASNGGSSALAVAYVFSRAIWTATEYGRLVAFAQPPQLNRDSLQAAQEPHERFTAWRDATITELREHTLPRLPAWPAWEIHRDRESLVSRIDDEWQRVPQLTPTDAIVLANDPRDEWLYKQAMQGTGWESLKIKLAKKRKWEPLSMSGIRLAVKRFAERNNLPPVPLRARGRRAR